MLLHSAVVILASLGIAAAGSTSNARPSTASPRSVVDLRLRGPQASGPNGNEAQAGDRPQFTAIPPGQLFAASIERGSQAYYSVTIRPSSPAYEHIDVTLTPLRGDVDMYITLDPTIVPGPDAGNWEYKSESHTSEDYDIIHTSDIWYQRHCAGQQQCVLWIQVRPAPWTSFGNNSFFLGATPSNENLQLQDGVALVDHAMENTWDYYKFVVDTDPGADAEVLISLTPYSGDPDCYASTSVQRPSPSNHDPGKSSMRNSRDVIRYYDTDGDSWCTTYPCTFYIGVTAYRSNASYGIMAHLRANNSITLVDGQSQYQYVQESEDLQFTYTIPPLSNIMEVIVTPVYGDPDLYVTLDGLPAQPGGNAQYASLSNTGSDIVLARPGDGIYDEYCTRGEACPARIGVYAFKPTFFNIVAYSGNALLLPENVPIGGIVRQDESDYYVYEYNGGPSAIVISVTPLSGDVDLYVDNDRGSTQMPGPGHYSWASRGSRLRQEVLEIFPSDGMACHVGNPCRYYIGVVGDQNTSAAYTMLVRTHDSTPTTLQPGQPLLQLVNVSGRVFYQFAFPPSVTSAEISISPTFGDPDLYASWGNRTLTTTTSDYRSMHISGDDTITPSRADDPICGGTQDVCYLTILVYGWTDSLFSIVGRAGGSSSQLIDGQSVGGSAGAAGVSYYTFQISSADAPAVYAVTPLSGDPDLYVATTAEPGPATPGVRRSEGNGHESIVYSQPEVADACTPTGRTIPVYPCTMYIAVRAASGVAAAWRITASTTPPTLSLSSPSIGTVDKGMLAFYTFHLPATLSGSGNVQVAVTPTSGSALVYVSAAQTRLNEPLAFPRLECSGGSPPPCPAGQARVLNYKYSSTTSLGGQTVTITDYVANADYAVAVMGSTGVNSPATIEFTITVTGPDSDRVLSSGVPVDGNVANGAYEFYRVIILSPGVDVLVSLTPYDGDPDLYVSWTPSNSHPNRSAYDMRSLGRADESIAVLAAEWGSKCSVQATEDGALLVSARHPAASEAEPTPGSPAAALAREADAGAQLAASSTKQELLHTSSWGGVSQCSIYIGVYGYSTASYSLVALVNSTSSTQLLDGQPQTGTLAKGQSALYSIPINLARTTDSFSIAVIPSGGDPDLYVNKGSAPGRAPGTYQHKSDAQQGTELINIGPTDASHCSSFCTVYALVYGFTATQYQIVYASNGVVVQLRDGVPQVATGTTLETSYYAINVPAGSDKLSVTLTVVSGEANLYMDVETGPDVRPNPSSGAAWSSSTFGDDSISVNNPTLFCPADADTGVQESSGFGQTDGEGCNFIIGVYSTYASRFTLVATLSETTVTQLVEGSPQQGVAPGTGFVYFYSVLPHVSEGSTVEFDVNAGSTSGAVDLFATDLWDPNSRPGEPGFDLPNATYWRYSTTNPSNRGGRGSIAVVWTGEPAPRSGFLAVAVRTRQAGVSSPFTISASSSESITTLQLSRPSAQRSVIMGETQHFLVQVTDVTADLVFSVNAFRGTVYVVVSTSLSKPFCSPSGSGGGGGSTMGTTCVGTWQANSATNPNLRISAVDPCASAFNRSCTNADEFRRGPFYIGVYGSTNAQYTVTVQQLTPTTLSDGVPERGLADYRPTYFALQLTGQAASHDIKFRLTRTDDDGRQTESGALLAMYIKSCVANVCLDSDRQPSASNNDLSVVVSQSVSSATAIAALNTAAHCQPPTASCAYFIGIETICQPGVLSCPTNFQLVAASQSGTAITLIDYSSISSDISQSSASVPPGQGAEFEVFLDPSSTQPTTDVSLSVEACGPGLPMVYVCDATCSDPFNPSPTNFAFSGNTATSGGKAAVQVTGTTASALYAAVVAPADATAASSFVFAAGANNPYILIPSPTAAGATASLGASPIDVQVSWEPVVLQSGDTRVAAVGVDYTVLARKDGFTGTGFVSTTACGLTQISSTPGIITRPTEAAATSATIGGLDAESEYAANVLATCDASCLQASISQAQVLQVRNDDGVWVDASSEPDRTDRARAALQHSARSLLAARAAPRGSTQRRALLMQAGGQATTQRVAVGKVAKVTTGAQPPPAAPEEGFPQGAIIGLSVMGGILVMGGVGFFCYRRMQAGAYRQQYLAFRGDGAMDTLPMPASGYAAMFDD